MYAQHLVPTKHLAILRKLILLANATSVSMAVSESSLTIQRQQNLGNLASLRFFTKKSKTAVATKETVANSQQQQQPGATSCTEAKVPSSSTESTPSAKKPARSLTVAAANRWKSTSLAAHSGSEWLVVNSDKGGYVVSLNCSICKTYADIIKGMKNFSAAWAFNGSTNLRISNAEDHARGKPHRKALDLHLKDG